MAGVSIPLPAPALGVLDVVLDIHSRHHGQPIASEPEADSESFAAASFHGPLE